MNGKKLRRALLGALAAVTLGGLGITQSSPVAAEGGQNGSVCTEQVPVYKHMRVIPGTAEQSHQEFLYERETSKTQFEVDKVVRERSRERVAGFWQNFEPNQDQGTFEGPPTWPSDPRGTWSAPKTNGGPGQDQSGVFQNGSGNGSWFYRQQTTYGEWSAWSEPTRWTPTGSHLDWVDVIPAPNWQEHGNSYTDTYQRDWAVLGTGNTKQVPTGTETSEWRTSPPEGDGWVQVDERKVVDVPAVPDVTEYLGPNGVPTLNEAEAAEVEESSVDGWTMYWQGEKTVEVECPPDNPSFSMELECTSETSVMASGVQFDFTAFDSLWINLDGGEWVPVWEIDTSWEREFTGLAPGAHTVNAELRRKTGPNPSDFEVLSSSSQTDTCQEDTEVTTSTAPPTTEPPVTTAPPTTAPPTTEPPVTTAPPTTQAPPSGELPATGGQTSLIAAIAAAALLAGGGLVLATRFRKGTMS